jgi:DNA-directed RNA polymerase specialized sigma24 family protein
MQPPTDRTAAGPHDNVDELYRRHHHELQRSVAGVVRAPKQLIEDACQTAWMIMLRAEPHCHSVFGWLRAVAIHEAYRLMAIERQATTRAFLRPRTEDVLLQLPDQRSLEDALEALDTLRLLAALPERQRTDLALKVAGYSYKEIQARTPGRTWTSVNHSLVKARARIGRSRS